MIKNVKGSNTRIRLYHAEFSCVHFKLLHYPRPDSLTAISWQVFNSLVKKTKDDQ